MNTLLVAYDLSRPGQNYAELIEDLKSMPAWWHHLDSAWLIRTDLTPVEARDRFAAHLDATDELLVIEVSGRAAAWRGFSDRGSTWIKNHL